MVWTILKDPMAIFCRYERGYSCRANVNLFLCIINYAPCIEDVWSSGVVVPPFLIPVMDWDEWSASHPSSITPDANWSCVGPRACLNSLERKKTLANTGNWTRFLCCQASSKSSLCIAERLRCSIVWVQLMNPELTILSRVLVITDMVWIKI